MLQLSISAENALPLVDQIVTGVRSQIEDRVLRPGARLPAIRQLAEAHRISRFTVVEAYDRLVAQGYVQSRRGSGFYVANRTAPIEAAKTDEPVDRGIDAAWLMRQSLDAGAEGLRASAGWLPGSWLDDEGIRRHLRAMLRNEDSNFTDYGRPLGFQPLREHLSFRLGELGIAAAPDRILPTHGATQALDLCSHHFVRRGDTVFVGRPRLFLTLRQSAPAWRTAGGDSVDTGRPGHRRVGKTRSGTQAQGLFHAIGCCIILLAPA